MDEKKKLARKLLIFEEDPQLAIFNELYEMCQMMKGEGMSVTHHADFSETNELLRKLVEKDVEVMLEIT